MVSWVSYSRNPYGSYCESICFFVCFFFRYYMVLDEAQNIKNFKTQKWQTMLNFNSQRRLLLTGTPLQNDLLELWALMHFLMVRNKGKLNHTLSYSAAHMV